MFFDTEELYAASKIEDGDCMYLRNVDNIIHYRRVK
jgi:hypothetical protein